MSFWDDKKFKKEKQIWYQVLKATGFKDIEDEETHYLKEWDSNFFRRRFNPISYETASQYFRSARHLLQTYPFEHESHRIIWSLHCEGLSIRQIANQLRIYKKSMVHHIIKRISSRIKNE